MRCYEIVYFGPLNKGKCLIIDHPLYTQGGQCFGKRDKKILICSEKDLLSYIINFFGWTCHPFIWICQMSSSQSNAAPWVVGLADDDDDAFHRTSSVSLTPFGPLEWHPGTLSCTSFHSWPLCVGHTHILACHSQPSSPLHPPPYLCAGRPVGREQVGLAAGPSVM